MEESVGIVKLRLTHPSPFKRPTLSNSPNSTFDHFLFSALNRDFHGPTVVDKTGYQDASNHLSGLWLWCKFSWP